MVATSTAAAQGTSFSSSFEAGQPQPQWTDTADTDAAGNKKASGVDGNTTTRIPGSVMDQVTGVAASGDHPPSETKDRAVDGDVNTKWLVFAGTGWLQVQLAQPVTVVRYALTSANDSPGRDPQDWSLQGSPDGQSWTTLDTRTGQDFPERLQTREYTFANSTAYRYYRLNVTRNHGDPILQLAELQLSNGDTTPPPASDMKSFVDAGPAKGFDMKPGVGFTGLKALHYSGVHKAAGRAYSYNKVFDVDVPVTRSTELSYVIFPELFTDDRDYHSTYVSVDLAFTDGTYLSDLGAEDQDLVKLDPQAQGASKSLFADQWNYRRSRIGAVAAGKTIDRILVAYDDPKGTGVFNGWVDDIKIAPSAPQTAGTEPADYVLTTRGTNSSGAFGRGNTAPFTAVPNGFDFWTPETDAGSMNLLYEYQQANNADNLPTLQAFAVSHDANPWMGERQSFQVMPSAAPGTPNANRAARALAFRHDNETARAGYYGVRFENGIEAELAPTDHAAMFRFRFPGRDSSLIFDNVDDRGGLTLDPEHGVLSGYSDVASWLSTGATRMYVYATFDKPVTASGMLPGGGGPHVTGYMRFETGDAGTVTMRIATSLISVEQAKRNLAMEIRPDDSLEDVRARARKLWNKRLGVVDVEGANQDQLTTLYSSLYRINLFPNSGFENVGTVDAPHPRYASPVSPATGPSTPTQTGAKLVDGKIYVNNGFWDTYRTEWPAYSLFERQVAGELIDGFVQQYRDGGWISRWSSPGYANLMTGTSSDVAFADAYVKGVSGFDAKAAYEAAVKNATVAPPNANVGRKGLDSSIFLGYTPTSTPEGMSWAMEGYVNDFGIANMASALAKRHDVSKGQRRSYREQSQYFRNRARDYVNMFDRSVGFFQGRTPSGDWRLPPEKYDPRVWGYDYTETDGWGMAFTVPQDGQGLANLYGGRTALAAKLDRFFATPENGDLPGSYGTTIQQMPEAREVRMGQYEHNNQPSHHILYMYDYAGQPYKTQAKVREVLGRLYSGSAIGQGYTGDEDNGEMSAWWLFSSLGFYPLQAGSPYYAIGSPLFKKATVHLPNGHDIVVEAHGNGPRNVYVQGLTVNGEPYDKTYLRQSTLSKGAHLEFEMGPAPSRWGTGPDAAPPSLTHGDKPPSPDRDATAADKGVATGSSGVNVDALFDDTSASRVTFPTSDPWIQYHFTGSPQKVRSYTLTSGSDAAAGDPASWVVEGSDDGRRWQALDERHGQTFRWRLQTRPFRLQQPGNYAYYRIRVTGNSGPATTELAEVELMAAPEPVDLRVQPARLDLDEGSPQVVHLKATNNLPRDVSLTLTATAPDGFRLQPAQQALSLGAGESKTVDVTVTPGAGTFGTATIEFAAEGSVQRERIQVPVTVARPVFAVGRNDGSSAEFALSPNHFDQYMTRFAAGVDFTQGTDEASQGWSYIQPGPVDAWAGSRAHTSTLRFDLDEAPSTDLTFSADLLDTNNVFPPTLRVALNGGAADDIRLPGGGGDGYHWGDGAPDTAGGVRPHRVDVTLPRDQLRPGRNVLTISNVAGSWLVYDAFEVRELPPPASP